MVIVEYEQDGVNKFEFLESEKSVPFFEERQAILTVMGLESEITITQVTRVEQRLLKDDVLIEDVDNLNYEKKQILKLLEIENDLTERYKNREWRLDTVKRNLENKYNNNEDELLKDLSKL